MSQEQTSLFDLKEIDTENIFYKFNCWKNIKNNNTFIGETVEVNADAVYQAVYDEKVLD